MPLGKRKERTMLDRLFGKKGKKEEPVHVEKRASPESQPTSAASPLAQFDPAQHVRQKEARGDFCMRVESYRELAAALKSVPFLEVNDPRLPPTIEKTPKTFAEMLGKVEFYLGQSAMQGGRITVETHHGLFAFATDGTFKYEIAKLTDDAYLFWTFAHDPKAEIRPLFSGRTCAFKLKSEPSYSCAEKAVTVSPEGFCLFHMKKGNADQLAESMGGVLWATFKSEYESRLNERVNSGNYDFRGFQVIGWLSRCLREHTFKTLADFSDAFLGSAEFEKSIFEATARFDRAIFDWTVSFNDAIFKGEVSFAQAKFQHHGMAHLVWFRNTEFEAPVDFTGVDFTPEETRTHERIEPSVRMETVRFKGGVDFTGATGVAYIQAENPVLRRILETQGSSAPPKPSDEKLQAWQQQLAAVTERLLKEPSLSGLWGEKASLEITIHQELLQRGEDAATCHLRLGYASLFSGRASLAKPHFEKCLELRKDWPEALLGLARCELYWARTSKETELLLLSAAQKDPQMVSVCGWPGNDVNLWLGVHYTRAGDPGRAVAYLKRAVELNPKAFRAHEHLGQAYLAAGYGDEAIASLEREVELYPAEYGPHLYLEAIYAALGNAQKAAYHRNQATYHNPGQVVLTAQAVQEIYSQVKRARRVSVPKI
jgi:tetratricopeptide (TPR) repeat protein